MVDACRGKISEDKMKKTGDYVEILSNFERKLLQESLQITVFTFRETENRPEMGIFV